MDEANGMNAPQRPEDNYSYDYSYVDAVARVACYDDLGAAPRITKIEPAGTDEFIDDLATTVYEQAKLIGGVIPYTVIREVSENFIHAKFVETTVSIFDGGNTIRFSDQGPGIPDKSKAQLPGFSSAIEPMKDYIRGVGSGFPIVCDYLENKHGVISIEDNIRGGAVVTISLDSDTCKKLSSSSADEHADAAKPCERAATEDGSKPQKMPLPALTPREKDFLPLFLEQGALGVTDIANLTGTPASSTFNVLKKLETSGLLEHAANQKRELTDYGREVARALQK